MKKKEILIVLLLAVFVTGSGWVWKEIIKREANSHGFPFKFFWYISSGGVAGKPPYEIHYTSMLPQWNYRNLTLDFLFWSLLIFGIWQARKIFSKK